MALEAFGSLLEARVLVEDWRIEYNTVRPHSALGGPIPAEYGAKWASVNQPSLHSGWTDARGPIKGAATGMRDTSVAGSWLSEIAWKQGSGAIGA